MRRFYKILTAAVILTLSSLQLFAAPKVSEERQKLISYALKYVGTKYVWGGSDPVRDGGLDCSGYVSWCINHAVSPKITDNGHFPRLCNAMYDKMTLVDAGHREPGDLVFFKANKNAEKITHVGIYCGVYHGPEKKFEGKRVFLSAISDGPRTGVQIELMDARYWKEHYYATGSFLPKTKR
ncbi:C40 family peptidase [Treponema sp.]|uniref:C40 family peptidase n=1 Tax=Treponema sp. TaxID=166 RepID=UPI0025F36C08|nr:C40 family peptidase [Treponema sp.]MCR5217947.1 C40 family peptidase [Treponema sp.]